MARKQFDVIIHNGREYVKYGSMLFKCCKPNTPHPSDWVWIKEVQRYVCYRCF